MLLDGREAALNAGEYSPEQPGARDGGHNDETDDSPRQSSHGLSSTQYGADANGPNNLEGSHLDGGRGDHTWLGIGGDVVRQPRSIFGVAGVAGHIERCRVNDVEHHGAIVKYF